MYIVLGGKGKKMVLITGLKKGTRYYFIARPQKGCKEGVFSKEVNVMTLSGRGGRTTVFASPQPQPKPTKVPVKKK